MGYFYFFFSTLNLAMAYLLVSWIFYFPLFSFSDNSMTELFGTSFFVLVYYL
jgi:hypothetical protein